MDLIITRELWNRGEGSSYPHNPDGTHCALGFLCLALGCVTQHGNMDGAFARTRRLLARKGAVIAALDANDARDLTDAEREEQLTVIFAANGINVRFVNAAAPVTTESPVLAISQ